MMNRQPLLAYVCNRCRISTWKKSRSFEVFWVSSCLAACNDETFAHNPCVEQRSAHAFEKGPLMLRNISGPLLNARTVCGQKLLYNALVRLRQAPKHRNDFHRLLSKAIFYQRGGTVIEAISPLKRDWFEPYNIICIYAYGCLIEPPFWQFKGE